MSVAEELSKLKQLHEDGTLSDEEFASAKANLLKSPAPSNPEASASPAASGTASDPLGIVLLLLPILGLGILYFAWDRASSEFMLLEARTVIDSAKSFFYLGTGIVILGSAILVGIDATRLGFGREKKHPRSALRTGPAAWAIGQVLLWIVAYPWYMASRRAASPSAKNFAVGAVLLAIFFSFGALAANWAIDTRVEQVQGQVRAIQRNLEAVQTTFGE